MTTGPTPVAELRRRMTLPQRHRLLHGYPLAAALHSAEHVPEDRGVPFNRAKRELLVGVLPHPYCNPAVAGCGYCTFPHEPGNAAKGTPVVQAVRSEIRSIIDCQISDLFRRPITALYFGGGTANLTEPGPFHGLCKQLEADFDLKKAEVTLEGVPAYFLRGKSRLLALFGAGEARLLDVLKSTLSARHFRLSMGIQTFDEDRLKTMGRTAFGNAETFQEVVELGHKLGFTASADLLFNLPGQTLEQMRHDVRRAVEIGLDHIGLYHLVLFRGLGTPWADDDNLLAELPDNERACENWLALREELLGLGFTQTTLTNFERKEYLNQQSRYQYEECSFLPDEYEMLGFGPSAVSYVATPDFGHGIKTMNPTGADDYVASVKRHRRIWNKMFIYRPRDQKVLWLTRRLAALQIERDRYRKLFYVDVVSEYADEIRAMSDAGLIDVTNEMIRPTAKGMFYSDSIAALFANQAIRTNRERGPAKIGQDAPDELLFDVRESDASHQHMG
jgi:coproporphyrinogen III oxidase-like Fe-S oxidoreductase